MRPLLLTGPPAAGKSTTARDLAKLRPRSAVVDVDDIRHLIVSGHAAPWHGDEGRLQQRIGVENACDLASRLHSIGVDVLIADVIDADTLGVYRRRLPDVVVVRLQLTLAEARRRAATRPVYLTDREFGDLHAADEKEILEVDAFVDVSDLARDEQTAAVMRVWASASEAG